MGTPRKNLEKKLNELIQRLRAKESVIVALSGGIDSSLVAAICKIALGDNAIAVTANSATLPPGELEEAQRIAKELEIKHLIIKVDELANPDFAKNSSNRCYYCKKELITELKKVAKQKRIKTIVEGTNAEDLKTHRPGAKALKEEGAYSPLAEMGITKNEVREMARLLNLSITHKPSMACLSSRIPYGEKITIQRLTRIAEAEKIIKNITDVKQLRVRDHGNLARIEVNPEERKLFFKEKLLDTIAEKLRTIGYTYITIDVNGYRTGSMNETLK